MKVSKNFEERVQKDVKLLVGKRMEPRSVAKRRIQHFYLLSKFICDLMAANFKFLQIKEICATQVN